MSFWDQKEMEPTHIRCYEKWGFAEVFFGVEALLIGLAEGSRPVRPTMG
jgi:hypothetical protein